MPAQWEKRQIGTNQQCHSPTCCAIEGRQPEPRELFDNSVSYERLLSAFQGLRVPRHLFRFLWRLLVEHSNKYTDASPKYQVDAQTFESVLAVYSREMENSLT